MNYSRIYNSVIQNALLQTRSRTDNIYYELHHIVPKCLGGTNDKENLVLLTAREHFLCHHLLVKIYPKNAKLIHAFWLMCNIKNKHQQNRYIPSSSIYQEARELNARIGASEETKRKMSKSHTGSVKSEEIRKKISIGNSKPKSRLTCPHCGIEGGGISNMQRWHFDNCKEKLENFHVKRQSSNANILTECPYCNRIGGVNVMHRWHFENCKFKTNLVITE